MDIAEPQKDITMVECYELLTIDWHTYLMKWYKPTLKNYLIIKKSFPPDIQSYTY